MNAVIYAIRERYNADKFQCFFGIMLCVIFIGSFASIFSPCSAWAADSTTVLSTGTRQTVSNGTIVSGDLTVTGLNKDANCAALEEGSTWGTWLRVRVPGVVTTGTITVKSNNVDVANVASEYQSADISSTWWDGDDQEWAFCLQGINPGKTQILVSCNGDVVTVPVVVYPKNCAEIVKIKKSTFKKVRVSWERTTGASGYIVQRALANTWGYTTEEFKNVKTVVGETVNTVTIVAPWETNYSYRVVPYVEHEGKRFFSDYPNGKMQAFSLPKPNLIVSSVKRTNGNKNLQVKWTADDGATKFVVYRSTQENRGYKELATLKGDDRSFTDTKNQTGVTYYYKVRAWYPSGYGRSDLSNSVGNYIPISSKVIKKRVNSNIQPWGWGQYNGAWAHSDDTYYYKRGTTLYAVIYNYSKNALCLLGFNESLDQTVSKTIALPKHDYWGGFYHGPDGNNYVVLGYRNDAQSLTKTVIKVIKYDSNWEEQTICPSSDRPGSPCLLNRVP